MFPVTAAPTGRPRVVGPVRQTGLPALPGRAAGSKPMSNIVFNLSRTTVLSLTECIWTMCEPIVCLVRRAPRRLSVLIRHFDGDASRHGSRWPSPFRQPELDGRADQKCDSEHRRGLSASERRRVDRPPAECANALNSIAPTFTVMVTKNGAGTGTVASTPAGINCGGDCNERFPGGTTVTLTATPSAGSVFTGWSGGGCSGTGSCVVSTTATVTATFGLPAPAPFTVTVNKNGTGAGTVISNPAGINCGGDCTETYPGGTTVTLTATADSRLCLYRLERRWLCRRRSLCGIDQCHCDGDLYRDTAATNHCDGQ